MLEKWIRNTIGIALLCTCCSYAVEVEDPTTVINSNLKFLTKLFDDYNKNTDSYDDVNLQYLWNGIKNLKGTPPADIIQKDGERAAQTFKRVLDIYLAQRIYRKISKDVHSPWTEYSAMRLLPTSYGPSNYFNSLLTFCSSKGDEYLMDMTEYLLVINTLSLIDPAFGKSAYVHTLTLNKNLWDYLWTKPLFFRDDLTFAAFKGYNNHVIRALSAIGINDIVNGNYFDAGNGALYYYAKECDNSGRFCEGTDYLNYTNEIFLPYVYFRTSIEGTSKIPEGNLDGIKKSGYWLNDIADPSGYIPEIDDAMGGKWYMLAPYIAITKDEALLKLSEHNQKKRYNPTIDFLTWPSPSFCAELGGLKKGSYSPLNNDNPMLTCKRNGNIGKINIRTLTGASTSLTLITEPKVLMVMNSAHDEPDHGSIILRRLCPEKKEPDDLICDPVYAGNDRKLHDGNDMFYSNHNTVQIKTGDEAGVKSCPIVKIKTGIKRIATYKWKITVIYNYYNIFISGSGGGVSWLTNDNAYSNGHNAIVQLDCGGYYNRATVALGETYYVFDRLVAFENNYYLVNYNLPPFNDNIPGYNPIEHINQQLTLLPENSISAYAKYAEGQDGIYDRGTPEHNSDGSEKTPKGNYQQKGSSKIRLSVFSNEKIDLTVIPKAFYRNNDWDETPRYILNQARFQTTSKAIGNTLTYPRHDPRNTNSGIPVKVPGQGICFLTIIEPKGDNNDDYPELAYMPYQNSGYVVAKQIQNDKTMVYAFESSVPSVLQSPIITINSFDIPPEYFIKTDAPKYFFITDAEFGLVQFEPPTKRIMNAHLYNVKSISYNNCYLNLTGNDGNSKIFDSRCNSTSIIPEVVISSSGKIKNQLTIQYNGITIIQTNPAFEDQNNMSAIPNYR